MFSEVVRHCGGFSVLYIFSEVVHCGVLSVHIVMVFLYVFSEVVHCGGFSVHASEVVHCGGFSVHV